MTTATSGSNAVRALSADELLWMRQWRELDFLTLEVHEEVEHEIRICMNGIEHAIIVGERGLGKSKAVQVLCDKIEQAEMELAMTPGSTHRPRRILRYNSSRAQGTKTALLDLWTQAAEGAPSAGMQKRSSPSLIIQEIVHALEMRNVALIVIDEAQMISPDNLDLLRQVPDAAKARGYALGMILIGSDELRASMVAIKQLGQRFATELRFLPLSSEDWAKYWSTFHPHLGELKTHLPAPEWKALTGEVFRVTSGKFRRIEKVLLNANELALSWKRPIDPEILRFALDKLAAES